MKQYIVDAFAERPFQGNPAAILPLGRWPEEDFMQKVAAENNLSETAFLVKEGDAYHIRWFTPGYEIDLCGHATLASAFVIKNYLDPAAERIRFTSKSGPLSVGCRDGRFTLDFPSRPPAPVSPLPALKEALGAEVLELYLARDLVAVVRDEQTVRRLAPDFIRLAALPKGDGVVVTAKGDACDFVSRCFYPKCGVNEDPVTGSAQCNLVPFWAERLAKNQLLARQLSARGGVFDCELKGDRVLMTGSAVLFAESDILIPFH